MEFCLNFSCKAYAHSINEVYESEAVIKLYDDHNHGVNTSSFLKRNRNSMNSLSQKIKVENKKVK